MFLIFSENSVRRDPVDDLFARHSNGIKEIGYIKSDIFNAAHRVGRPVMGDVSSEPRAEGHQCVDCGRVWKPKAVVGQHYHVSPQDYLVRCILKTYCRQRQLRRTLNLAAPDGDGRLLYGQIPTARLLHLADPRPPNWKEIGWKPIGTEMQRVDAYLLVHSVCYPVCMPYACKINSTGDDVVYKRHNIRGVITTMLEPEEELERDIAMALGMHQPNVSRALKGLIARHLWTRDSDGRTYIVPDPTPLALEERWALTEEGDREVVRGTGELRDLPSEFRARAVALIKQARADIRSDMLQRLLEPVRVFDAAVAPLRQQISHLRLERNQALEEALNEFTIISPREGRLELAAAVASDASTLDTQGEAVENPISRGIGNTRTTAPSPESARLVHGADSDLEEFYAAGLGNGMGKLPAREEREIQLVLYRKIKPHFYPETRLLTRIWKEAREARPDVTLEELLPFVTTAAPVASSKEYPGPYLCTVLSAKLKGDSFLQHREEIRERRAREQQQTADIKRQREQVEAEEEQLRATEARFDALPEEERARRLKTAEERLVRERRYPADREAETRSMAIHEFRREQEGGLSP